MNDLHALMLRLWESACADAPQRPSCTVQDGHFVFTIRGNDSLWTSMCAAAGVPAHAEQYIENNTLTCRWPSLADEIFGVDGLIAQELGAGYEVRQSQLQMARLVQRAIEMRQPAVIEAGTGVGKSFAYAAICMAMGKRVVIATSNKALQMQLYRKDIPFLQELFPGKTVALAVGKSNYACRNKVEDPATGGLAIEDAALRDWYLNTESGNTEEIPFAVDWRDLAKITVDDDCAGKHCAFYAQCFYYLAKETRRSADVLITNHALLCLHTLYPSAQVLPVFDVCVVDEAHKLPDYARSALGFNRTLTSIEKTINAVAPYVEDCESTLERFYLFKGELAHWSNSQVDANGKLPPQIDMTNHIFDGGEPLAAALAALAEATWPEGDMPTDAEDKRRARRAQKLLNTAEHILTISKPATDRHIVRWFEPQNDTLVIAPPDVSGFVSSIAGFAPTDEPVIADHTRCTRCRRALTADTVAILDGQPYGPECIRKVDVLGDAEYMALTAWLSTQAVNQQPAVVTHQATIFTSATLAAPDLRLFMESCGIPDALQMQATSPFDYENNALLYVPNGNSPQPNDGAWSNWAVDQMRQLVDAARGGAFLLFTSNANLRYASDRLRQVFNTRGYHVLVQGEMPKLEIARRFREDGNAVLFATRSFFEGVSIDGDALRLVVVDKLPFEAPSPLGTAMEAIAMERARSTGKRGAAVEMAGFNDVRTPRMTIELKQACGRLIRTQSDRGVLAVLDTRLRTSQYGRRSVLPALPPAQLCSELSEVQSFFQFQEK